MKERHGCATAYLVVSIATVLLSLLGRALGGGMSPDNPEVMEAMSEAMPGLTPGLFLLWTVLGVVNLAFLVGVWMWKRRAFYGYLALSVISLPIIFRVFPQGDSAWIAGAQVLGIGIFLLAMLIGQPNTVDQLE